MKTFKKILLGLLLLVFTIVNAQFTGIGNRILINQGGGEGTTPIYENNGGLQAFSGSSSGNINYPTGVNDKDILILQLISNRFGLFFTPPAEWTKIIGYISTGDLTYEIYWTRADGTETGSISVSMSPTDGTTNGGTMSRYSGAVESGVPYTGLTGIGAGFRTITSFSPDFAPTVNSLGLGFFWQKDNQPWTNGSSNYTRIYYLSSSFGADLSFSGQEFETLIGGADPGVVQETGIENDDTAGVGILLTGK